MATRFTVTNASGCEVLRCDYTTSRVTVKLSNQYGGQIITLPQEIVPYFIKALDQNQNVLGTVTAVTGF